ncbi:MAG: hypothetical protein SNJ64_01850 [Endomicrobiia bacterium]
MLLMIGNESKKKIYENAIGDKICCIAPHDIEKYEKSNKIIIVELINFPFSKKYNFTIARVNSELDGIKLIKQNLIYDFYYGSDINEECKNLIRSYNLLLNKKIILEKMDYITKTVSFLSSFNYC